MTKQRQDLQGLEGKFTGDDLGRLITIKGKCKDKPVVASGYVQTFSITKIKLGPEPPENRIGGGYPRVGVAFTTGDNRYYLSFFNELIYRDDGDAKSTEPVAHAEPTSNATQ